MINRTEPRGELGGLETFLWPDSSPFIKALHLALQTLPGPPRSATLSPRLSGAHVGARPGPLPCVWQKPRHTTSLVFHWYRQSVDPGGPYGTTHSAVFLQGSQDLRFFAQPDVKLCSPGVGPFSLALGIFPLLGDL